MKSIYWFTNVNSPDEAFFKYGGRKPNENWCMFDNLLSAYNHAYKHMIEINYAEECVAYEYLDCACRECGSKLPDNPSVKDYEDIFNKYDYPYEEYIIEIPVWS